MKDIQNDKTLGIIAVFAFILGIAGCVLGQWTIGGLLLAMALVIGILLLQIKIRRKNKKNRYHAVHWNGGHLSKDN